MNFPPIPLEFLYVEQDNRTLWGVPVADIYVYGHSPSGIPYTDPCDEDYFVDLYAVECVNFDRSFSDQDLAIINADPTLKDLYKKKSKFTIINLVVEEDNNTCVDKIEEVYFTCDPERAIAASHGFRSILSPHFLADIGT